MTPDYTIYPKRPFWTQVRRDYFTIFFLVGLILFVVAYFKKVSIEHDGYAFTFPLTVKSADSLFFLNARVSNGRIARVNSEGCKEVQITMDIIVADSGRAHKVEAVSFYHTEAMSTLKQTLEDEYGRNFEPFYYYHSEDVHYYVMHVKSIVILLYPTNFRACLNPESTIAEQLKYSDKLSVVAFTPLLTDENEFAAFVTLDGHWRE